ncbi:hypothetical protein I6H96_02785 [Brucella anthropi]|uniref:hypothetical protein n=1 Tax=Brucella anthropi TaxID=529 RepID=UPI0003153A38|nr:hypothetical protein [Brucella anthropi]NKC48158.1 hypothetical protein [Brucella anthropi ATCC 49188]QQC25807.1 hypothetical protein I6H96_02785 [Brucella anthropi]
MGAARHYLLIEVEGSEAAIGELWRETKTILDKHKVSLRRASRGEIPDHKTTLKGGSNA